LQRRVLQVGHHYLLGGQIMKARTLVVTLSVLCSIASIRASEKPYSGPSATILCYHIVESPRDPRMEISRETFRQQMKYLGSTGYNIISLSDLYAYVAGRRATLPRNAVVITVDDGWRSTYTEFYPEMKRRHFPFTVFLYPKIIGQTSHALTWSQVREMSKNGADIQSHSLSHPFLTSRRHPSLDSKSYHAWLENELLDSKRILEKETGRTVNFLAYPYGDYDTAVARSVARAGYAAALTCDFGRVHRGSDPLRFKRMVIDKRMSFASFRHYLGVSPLRLEETMPEEVFNPDQPVISARIASYKQLDPNSVGMALLSVGATPFSYDPRDGSISLVVRDALKGEVQRAIVWGTDSRSGKRVEAIWSFRLPPQLLPDSLPDPSMPALIMNPGSRETPSTMPGDGVTPAAPAGSPGRDDAPIVPAPGTGPASGPGRVSVHVVQPAAGRPR
jgi:peptidoglycan/xylan/chitin deacetylase (PgdA/CDA1 family)